jgi:hypothetical protein
VLEADEAADIEEIQAWAAGLDAVHARIAGQFARAEPRRRVLAYLLGNVTRKNGWQLAEHAVPVRPRGEDDDRHHGASHAETVPLLAGGESAHEPETGHRPRHKGSPFSGRGGVWMMDYRAGDGPPRRISMTVESSCRPNPARRPARYSCSAADASGAG